MITIIIPTKDRSEFIIRLLNYYSVTGFKGCICIGDSSSGEHLVKTKKVVQSLQPNLNVRYLEYPELEVSSCVEKLVATINTPYAAFLGDDDLLITPAVEQSVEFLENQMEFNAAWGRAIKIKLDSDFSAHGKIVKCVRMTRPVVDGDSACQRLLDWVDYPRDVLFAVHRTKNFVNMYKDAHLMIGQYHEGGTPPNMISVTNGKVKELPQLFLIRQGHAGRIRFSKDYPVFRRNTFKKIISTQWFNSYHYFHKRIVAELIEIDGISQVLASEVVEQCLSKYYIDKMQREYLRDYPQGPHLSCFGNETADNKKNEQHENNLWRLNFINTIMNVGKKIMSKITLGQDRYNEMSLASLLDPKSPYFDDFMPAYKIINRSSYGN